MILVAISVFTILAFVCFIYINNKAASLILTLISVLGLIISSYFGVINWKNHYGLEKYTETTSKQVYSVSPSKQLQMILYQPIGTKNNKQVYIYKASANAKKTSTTQATSTTTNKLKSTTGNTRIVTKTVRWRYKSGAAKFWFGLTGENHKFVKRTNYIYVNKNWVTLTVAQSKALSKQMKSKTYQAKLKAEAKAFVTKQVTAAMTKNPTMSSAEQAKVTKQATAQFQAQAVQKLIASLK